MQRTANGVGNYYIYTKIKTRKYEYQFGLETRLVHTVNLSKFLLLYLVIRPQGL